MASVSASTISSTSTSSIHAPPKKPRSVFSNRRKSSEVPSDSGTRSSTDSSRLEKSSTIQSSGSSQSHDGLKSGSAGVRKLIPGHGKRQRTKLREEELRAALESDARGRSTEQTPATANMAANKSNSSLLTDAEVETPPPMVSRDSHRGYFTTSSPAIVKTVAADNEGDTELVATPTREFPSIIEPDPSGPEVSPTSTPKLGATPTLPTPGLVDRADTLQVDTSLGRRSSISSRLRGKSPARKVRDIFSKTSRSPKSSPERGLNKSFTSTGFETEGNRLDQHGSIVLPGQVQPVRGKTLPALETELATPKTPPATSTPLTTITPPTPTEKKMPILTSRDMADKENDSDSSGITVSPSGNMISHRRVRSASSAMHSKSKLSTSMIAPLTPTIEELRSPSEKSAGSKSAAPGGGGFFSSWVSAAQNAASSLTSLTAQNRARAGTGESDATKAKTALDTPEPAPEVEESAIKKQLAVETLGSGNLNFGHLGISNGADEKDRSSLRPNLNDLRQLSDFNRNEAQAKEEDAMAQRAVSAAYEKPSATTPVAEISDPIASLKSSQTMDSMATAGNSTTPNGSILDGETGPVKRSNSVRSRLANRRSRGSSVATGQSTIGAMISASTATLISPATTSKVTGFTPAPKARNRGFHQQFRSVPEDDNLIEDYSCALQREILLAGRIYISEGHICFSSNILGWVTTLIISFEEIVSIERENTAMIIPNAIAIQTLHARHTIRSLLSREATFDLIIGIWKVNHPASFQKSVNGKQLIAERAQAVVANASSTNNEEGSQGSDEDSDEGSGSDDENDDDEAESVPSLIGSNASFAGSEFVDPKSVVRKSSGMNGTSATPGVANGAAGEIAAAAAVAGVATTTVDFPGPSTHSPTECTESSTHYDKVIKDEVIPAPLGKIYTLLYGPQSGAFVRKYLVDECKCTDLVLEDDKKGLTNENKSRQYSYTKPLNGSIGPKSTKCITTENLDFFDLEKAVSITCTTQTPSVPNGNIFSTKTKYCLTWAPGNATRLQMNCTIEWTGKSWVKGLIENGANEGQQQYGDGLVKALKAAVGRTRATTVGSKGAKSKKKRKGERKSRTGLSDGPGTASTSWGILEPLRPMLEPATNMVKPVARMDLFVGLLAVMVFSMWFGGSPRRGSVDFANLPLPHTERMMAYEELWQHQDSELWDWLEQRTGVDRIVSGQPHHAGDENAHRRHQIKQRSKQLKNANLVTKLRAEKWSHAEMREAVRVTQERLDAMRQALDNEPDAGGR